MGSPFVPVLRIEDLVLAERVPGHHFEQLWIGAHPDDHTVGGPAIPVVLHDGPPRSNTTLDDDPAAWPGRELTYVRNRLRLKLFLGGRGVPRILRLVHDARVAGTDLMGYVEEHAGDVSVARLLARNAEAQGQLPIGVCLAIVRAIAVAHDALANASIDMRMGADPRDVFIDDLGQVRSLVEPRPGLRRMETDGGGPRNYYYLSPEEIAGTHTDHRGPMVGLGLLLFELVAGHYPFHTQRAEDPIALLAALHEGRVPSLSASRQDVPAPVAWLVERLTRRDPDQRYSTWSEVLAAIDGASARSERASAVDVATLCGALCPEEMALTRERREEIAVANLATMPLPTRPHRRLSIQRGAPPVPDTRPEEPRWDERTPVDIDAPFIGQDGQPMWRLVLEGDAGIEDWPPLTLDEFEGGPARPRVLLVDAVPVTHDAWARFCIDTGRPPPPSWGAPVPPPELGETPVVDVSHADATAYARHYGKELPTESLWLAAVIGLGTARLQVGAVWEWTTTPRRDGHGVCGGRFQDSPEVASDGTSTSWEYAPAADLGFRCVIREEDPDR